MRLLPISISLSIVVAISGAARAEPQLATSAEPAQRLPLVTGTLGFGGGYIGGNDASQGAAFHVGLGYHVTPRLQLAFDGDFVTFARDAADPTQGRQVGDLLLGVRYRPFGDPFTRRGLDLSDLEVGAGLGLAHEILIPYGDLNPFAVHQGAFGPAVAASIAWLPLHGADWHAGIELQASYDRFAGDPHAFSTSGLLVLGFDLGAARAPQRPVLIAQN